MYFSLKTTYKNCDLKVFTAGFTLLCFQKSDLKIQIKIETKTRIRMEL